MREALRPARSSASFRTTCRSAPTSSMDDVHPGDGLTIRQVLRILREQISQCKPPDLTLEAEEAREYEQGINDVLLHVKYLVNSFRVTVRVPQEILNMVCSYLTTGEDVFSASQVFRHWRGVLTSSPSLWTQFPCDRVSRTVVGLERWKSTPTQLAFCRKLSIFALKKALLHGTKIASLTINHRLDGISLLHQLFASSGPSVKRLLIRCQERSGWRSSNQTAHELWQSVPSLRELFVCQYSIPIDQLVAPNLVHLALEEAGFRRDVTVKSISDALRGCPRLETRFINHSRVDQIPGHNHSPVAPPHLRSIELGTEEVRSGLATHLQLPKNIAAGFRMEHMANICGNISSAVMATMQHVLKGIDTRCITLAAPLHPKEYFYFLVRFEGLRASLEVTSYAGTYEEARVAFFGRSGVLSSHSRHIENVRELHIIGCYFVDEQALDYISTAMPHVVSISFFHCDRPQAFVLPPETGTSPSSPPFPHLERIMVLGPLSGLRAMAKTRRDHGIPLKTLVVGRGPEGFEYGDLEDHALLGEFVEVLHIKCPTEVSEWETENEILNIWSAVEIPCPYILTVSSGLFKFCRFNIPG